MATRAESAVLWRRWFDRLADELEELDEWIVDEPQDHAMRKVMARRVRRLARDVREAARRASEGPLVMDAPETAAVADHRLAALEE